MRLLCISDTHQPRIGLDVPDGDVLIHAGDHTFRGSIGELDEALGWLGTFPHKHKIVIAGNHDWSFADHRKGAARELCKAHRLTYLEDGAYEIDGVKFYGSPWQPWFYDWAFNAPRGQVLADLWSRIPDDTQVLITHGPPFGIRDKTPEGERVGCRDLRRRVNSLPNLKVHVFGHIHHGYGHKTIGQTKFINASISDERYYCANVPVVIDI